MKTALLILAGTTLLMLFLTLAAPIPGPATSGGTVAGMPWEIELLSDGDSRVFGLTPGRSTLDEANGRFGAPPQVAIVAAPGESGTLEAYFETVSLGFLTGKMVLTLDATPEAIARMRARALKTEYMDGTTRKAMLNDEDIAVVSRATIRVIAFVPSAQLDETTIIQRFGPPAERLHDGENIEHFLYPFKGLDVVLDHKGKELLQYVAPRDFARLREPLLENRRPAKPPRDGAGAQKG